MFTACVERCVSLVLGHPFEFSWLDVSQTDVRPKIDSYSISGTKQNFTAESFSRSASVSR
jgi:hypothetical protein